MNSSTDSTAQQTQPQGPQEPQLSLLRFCGSNYMNKINALREAQKRNPTRQSRNSAVAKFIIKTNVLGEAQKRNFSLPKGKVPPAEAGKAPIPGPLWWDDG
jgi:hypothetical protein